MLRLKFWLACCGGTLESVAITTREEEPDVLGVPEMVPLLLRERPGGNAVPVPRVHVTGGVPPLDCKVALYGTLTVPLGSEAVVTAKGGGAGVVTIAAADLVVSLTEVAVIVTVRLLAGGAGRPV